ncbi:universal stress protein [Nocardia sp. NPDC047038]|uniref:universal stress protein n=1 Tax=Nocardia sp. NPDC047038 TaxID=3154338 RepID=UPI0033DA3CB6
MSARTSIAHNSAPPPTRTIVDPGPSEARIIRTAETSGSDLIVIGSRRSSRLGHAVPGATSRGVLLHATGDYRRTPVTSPRPSPRSQPDPARI